MAAATSSTKRTKYDYLCSICLEPMRIQDRDSALTGCNHFFHTQCILPWVQRTGTCPLCRSIVPALNHLGTMRVTLNHGGHYRELRDLIWKWFSSVQPSYGTSVAFKGVIDDSTELQLSILQLGGVLNDIRIMQLGLDLGIDINSNNATYTPLCLAAYRSGNETDVAEFLLEHKADIDRKTSPAEYSALSIAVQRDDKKLALFLLEHGANACILDNEGMSPLHHCTRESSHAMCEMLLRFPTVVASIDIQMVDGTTALGSACERDRNVDFARLLLEKKADPNRGMPILHCHRFTDVNIYQVLLAAKADINCQHPKTMESALHLVMARPAVLERHNHRVLEFLLDSKANVNLKDADGFTPLLCGEEYLPDELYFKFVAAGASVIGPLKGCHGRSLLHTYAREGRDRVCRSLIELKASVHTVDSNYATPLHRAVQCGSAFDACKLLCDFGAPVDSRDKFGFTPLSNAITSLSSSLDICRLLIERRANVNRIAPLYGNSLLCIAVCHDLASVCELLILNKADMSLTSTGKTAIQIAMELSSKSHWSGDCLRVLLHHSPPLSRVSNLSLAGASTKSGSHNHVRSDSTGMADLLFKNTSPQFRMRYVREKFDEQIKGAE